MPRRVQFPLYLRHGVRRRHHTVHRLQRVAAQEVHWTVTGPVQCVRRRQRPIRVPTLHW